MASEVIQVGNKVEMRTLSLSKRSSNETAQEQEVFNSQFLQWTDFNVAMISAPVYQNRTVFLRPEDMYELRFFTEGGLYRCRVSVVRTGKTENQVAVAEVKFISALEKYQRRQFYRMNCSIPLNYAVLTEEQRDCITMDDKAAVLEGLIAELKIYKSGVTQDISGGGIRFYSEVQQNSGDIILLQLGASEKNIRNKLPFLFGRVISSKCIPGKEPIAYDNRVEFIELSYSEQEKIITYIFKEERSRRKREADFK